MRATAAILLGLCAPALGARLGTLSPQVTELVFALGKGPDVVGASAFSLYPPQAAQLPSLGAYFMPSLEKTLALGIETLAVDSVNSNPHYLAGARNLGLRLFTFDLSTVESLGREGRRFLKELYGEEAPEPFRSLEDCLGKYRPQRPFRFLALNWLSPPMAFSTRTFLSELLTRMGGTNVVPASWSVPFPELSEEWILSQSVEVVLFFDQFGGTAEERRWALDRWWPHRRPRTVLLPADAFARASLEALRRVDALELAHPPTEWRLCAP